jgi:hypothetical protein
MEKREPARDRGRVKVDIAWKQVALRVKKLTGTY